MEFAKEQVQTIVKNINRLIKERHMLKGDFYKAIGISSAGFSQWNVGATVPTMQKLVAAADVLGVDVTELLTEESIKKEPTLSDGLNNELAEIILKLSPADRERLAEFGKALLASSHNQDI